jgi:hypothetical protein
MQKKIISFTTFIITISYLSGGFVNSGLVDVKGWKNVTIELSLLAVIELIAIWVLKKKFQEKTE